MIVAEIRDRLAREPLQAFLVRASNGKEYVIRDPALVVPMKSWLFIAHANSDRSVTVPYLHISGVESLANGHTARRSRRRGRS